MSGIVGWVDFSKDLARFEPTVRAMAATMAPRGPDAEGIWTDGPVALGHRLLCTEHDLQARQPLVADSEWGPVATVVFSGTLYNLGELRQRLSTFGWRLSTGCSSDVALHAYLQWGTDCVEHLDGVFAFAVWDVRRRRLFLARDRLGMKPLYYVECRNGLLFASEPKALLAHPLMEPELDAEGLAELFCYAGTPDHGVLRDVRKLRGGHVATVDTGGIRTRRYWQLSAYQHTEELPQTIEHVRHLLLDSVARQADTDRPVGFLLSGGLDSSVVVGLAAKAGVTPPLRTYTVTFADYEQQFRPDFVRGTPDAPYVRALADHVAAEHRDIVLDTADLLDPVSRRNAIRAKDLPSMLGDMNTSLYLLCQAAREHITVALSGETADSVFGGNVYDAEDVMAERRETLPWVRFHAKHAGHHAMGGGLFDPGLLERLDLLNYGADRRAESFAETPLPDGLTAEEKRARQDAYLQLTRWADSQLAHSERNAMATGLDVRMPFADHKLVDYVFNVPSRLKNFDSEGKSLLRAAAEGTVPETVLHRPKSPFPVSVDPEYQQVLHEQLSRLAADRSSPVQPLLDQSAIKERLDAPEALASDWVARTDVEMALSLDQWVRSYGIRLNL